MPVTAKLSRKFYDALGDDVANELVEWFNQVDATYRLELRELNDLNFARFDARVGERFAKSEAHVDRRFAEVEAKVDRRFSELDVAMERRFARLETLLERRLGETKSELIRWTFAFWIGTALAVVGLKAL